MHGAAEDLVRPHPGNRPRRIDIDLPSGVWSLVISTSDPITSLQDGFGRIELNKLGTAALKAVTVRGQFVSLIAMKAVTFNNDPRGVLAPTFAKTETRFVSDNDESATSSA